MSERVEVKIRDKEFAHESADKFPYVNFYREDEYRDLVVYTDRCLEEAVASNAKKKVAWLIESPVVQKKAYKKIKKLETYFDRILTFSKKHLDRGYPYVLCPFGTSWISLDEWSIYQKKKNLSIIASSKKDSKGHKLRHKVVASYKNKIDSVYGRAYTALNDKIEGLKDYRYSIAIENCKEDYYFSEKLIDCFATGTVPVYWGCPSIAAFFNSKGIIVFDKLSELQAIFNQLSEEDYLSRMDAIKENFELAKYYYTIDRPFYSALRGNVRVGRSLVFA